MLKLYLKSLTNFRFKTRASKHEFGNFFSVWLFVTVLLTGFLSLFCAFNFKSFADFVNSFFLTPEATVSMPMMVVFYVSLMLFFCFQVVSAISGAFIAIRRLHDLNLSGILYWLYVFVLYVFLFGKNQNNALFGMLLYIILSGLIVLIFVRGNSSKNNYGMPPEV